MLLLLLVSSFIFSSPTESKYAPLADRARIVPYGPSGTCPAAETTTFEVHPVYFCDFIPINTIIDPFRDGHEITVTNAPTVLVILSYITTIITPTKSLGGPTAHTTTIFSAGSGTLNQQPSSASASISTISSPFRVHPRRNSLHRTPSLVRLLLVFQVLVME